MVEIGQQTAGPRPRTDDENTHTQEPEEEPEDNLVSDNHADEYTDIPPHNLPPGYVDNATEEDPPAQSEPYNSSTEPRPSTSGLSTSNAQASSSGRGPKRRLPTEPSSDNSGKRQRKK